MNTRLKEVRKALKLSQAQMGAALGITNTAVSKIENGENSLTDQVMKLLCREFNVNEHWLRNGDGEMFIKSFREVEIAGFIGKMLGSDEDTFQKRLISALSKLDRDGWMVLEKIALEISQDKKRD